MPMNRNTALLIVLLIVLAAVGYMFYQRKAVQAPVEQPVYVAPTNDTPDAIDNELNSIDTGAQLDADIQSADKDIQSL